MLTFLVAVLEVEEGAVHGRCPVAGSSKAPIKSNIVYRSREVHSGIEYEESRRLVVLLDARVMIRTGYNRAYVM